MAAAPPLSVVMPVLNAIPFLDESIRSILGQSFADFEFVILDDGSTDGSTERLREWSRRDPRIRLFEGERRLGPAGSSNFVVERARAPIIARTDADDLAHPDRLRRQYDALAADPGAVLVGTLARTIDGRGRVVRGPDFARLVRRSPFAPFPHSATMFRRSAFEAAGGYRAAAAKWEDVDLVLRLARTGRLLVLAEALCDVRLSGANTRLADGSDSFEEAMDLMYRCLGERSAGRDYGPLLAQRQGPGPRLAPQSFVACGTVPLWAGAAPAVLARMLRRGALRLDPASARALVWAAWAGAHAPSLRWFLRALLSFRNRAALRRLGGEGIVEWRPS